MTELPAGYLLPPGWTMADVRRLDEEIMASEVRRSRRWGCVPELLPDESECDEFAARLLIAGKFLQEVKDAAPEE